MEIIKVDIYHIVMKLKVSFETSFGKTINRHGILVKVEDASGCIGWGETPVEEGPWYSYETIETTLYIYKEYLIPKLIKLRNLEHPKEFMEAVKGVRGYRMAKAGIEMALWDLKAKLMGKPLYKLLGGVRNYIVSGVSIGIIGDEVALLKSISNFLDEGYKRIKIKIKPGWDIYPVRLIRREFGDIPLQVDANAAYTLNDIGIFKELDNYDLLMIEQPLSYEDLYDHAMLQSQIKTPICLDESIKNLHDAKTALKLGSCKVINIKPARVGGLYESKLIHDYSMEKGIPIWIGGMLETGIGRGHLVAMATLPNVKYPNDISGSSRYWEEDIVEPPWVVRKDGTIELPEKPGIGVEVIEDRLSKYLRKKLEFRRE
ncbi:MAG: o-succinylbenzoate synthase [Thermoproteota archaeon]|nr:o-succinylbenzoate synthase [Thermoproteota archaeon]